MGRPSVSQDYRKDQKHRTHALEVDRGCFPARSLGNYVICIAE
jgi:hypothetical protein